MYGKTAFAFSGILLLVLISALVAGLFFVIFLSIVWTHRPDLTVREILREAVKEIKKIKGNQR